MECGYGRIGGGDGCDQNTLYDTLKELIKTRGEKVRIAIVPAC